MYTHIYLYIRILLPKIINLTNIYILIIGFYLYHGPKSVNPNSDKPEDLELFILPAFTSEHYYSTIAVRIPAEYLLHSTNLALQNSALWGTEIYSDDSDIVASKYKYKINN